MTSTKRMVDKTTTLIAFTSNNRARQPKIAARRSAAPAAAAAHPRKEHLRPLVPAFGQAKPDSKREEKKHSSQTLRRPKENAKIAWHCTQAKAPPRPLRFPGMLFVLVPPALRADGVRGE